MAVEDHKPVSKFIVTVLVGEEQAEEVQETLQQVAEALNARLTRSDWTPAEQSGYYHKGKSKTLHRQGRLA